MSRRGENIFKRRDGRWEARYVKGYELSGKIKYGFCYGKTYKEAKEKVEKMKLCVQKGIDIPKKSEQKLFSFYCDEWLNGQFIKVKESTYIRYETIVIRHIKPKLGNCYPLSMNDKLIEDFTQELLIEEKLSTKTVKDILVLLRSILKYTARQIPGLVPALQITYPKEKKKTTRVLSQKEQLNFIAYLTNDMDTCKFGILLALLTGIRIGELCALRWGDISIDEQFLHIHATMQRMKNLKEEGDSKTKVIIGTPKTDYSIRFIPLTDCAMEFCRKMEYQNPEVFVLTGTEHYMEPRTLQYRLGKYVSECELEGVHFHTLRHTFATRCVEAGFEIKSLSEILGHANTTITLERYVHSSMNLKRDNMRKLAALGL